MKVFDAMTKSVSVCRPADNLATVTATMWNDCCGALPVLDDAGTVTSIITDRDICIALGTRNRYASEVRVRDVSLPRVFTCGAYDDAQQALKTMVSQNVRRLPVVDEHGRIAGILSIDDLMRHAQESAPDGEISYREVVRATKAILEGRSPNHAHKPAELVATHA